MFSRTLSCKGLINVLWIWAIHRRTQKLFEKALVAMYFTTKVPNSYTTKSLSNTWK